MPKKKFHIGDQVSLINETTKGIIIGIENNEIITIKSDDGFEYQCNINEITKSGDFDVFLNKEEYVKFLNKNPPDNKRKKSLSKNKIPPLEVDLHIHQLIKSNKGMSNFEMLNLQLNTAKKQLETAINKKIQKVIFIHGVGDGVLKNELHNLFKNYPVEVKEASFQKYGQGATEIYIFQNT